MTILGPLCSGRLDRLFLAFYSVLEVYNKSKTMHVTHTFTIFSQGGSKTESMTKGQITLASGHPCLHFPLSKQIFSVAWCGGFGIPPVRACSGNFGGSAILPATL